MADEAIPFCRYQNNWYKLVFNETMLLLVRDEDFYLTLPPSLNNWKLRIKFLSNSNSLQPYPVQLEFPGDEIQIILTNWYSDAGVQTAEPLRLQSKNEALKVLLVIKTIANRMHNHRTYWNGLCKYET